MHNNLKDLRSMLSEINQIFRIHTLASLLISPDTERKKKENVEMVISHIFLQPLTLITLINYVKIFKKKEYILLWFQFMKFQTWQNRIHSVRKHVSGCLGLENTDLLLLGFMSWKFCCSDSYMEMCIIRIHQVVHLKYFIV